VHRGQGQFGVRRRRRRHHDAVHPRLEEISDRIGRGGTVFGGDGRDEIGSLIGDDQAVDAV
jgi:hypothetical protein